MGVIDTKSKNDTLNIRIRSDFKQQVQEILKEKNLTLTEVIIDKFEEIVDNN